jgi:hypothetical protein
MLPVVEDLVGDIKIPQSMSLAPEEQHNHSRRVVVDQLEVQEGLVEMEH